MTAVGDVGTFQSLRFHNYRLYLFGQGISVAGSWMQNIAIGWATLQISDSGSVLGLVTAARYVPMLLLGPWGGLIADRFDNRRMLVVTQTAQAGLAGLFTLLAWTGLLALPTLTVLVVVLGFIGAFDLPTRQSFLNQLVPRRYLGNAIGLNSVIGNCAKMVGPAAAGALLATVGETPCFAANATSYVAVVMSLVVMRKDELHAAVRETPAKRQIRDALGYIRRTPAILYPLLMVVVTGVLTWEFPVSLPLITTETFHRGAGAYGGAMACMAAGAVCGGLVAARRRQLTVRSLSVSALLWGALIVAASASPTLPVAFALLTFVGAGAITFSSSAKTLLQLAAAPTMRGRVMSLWSMAWQGGTVIGAPVVGAVGALAGARYGLALGGVTALAVGACVLRATRTQRYETPRECAASG